jgi:hypothetical protein
MDMRGFRHVQQLSREEEKRPQHQLCRRGTSFFLGSCTQAEEHPW